MTRLHHFPLAVTDGLVLYYSGDQPKELYGRGPSLGGSTDLAACTGRQTYRGYAAQASLDVDVPMSMACWVNCDTSWIYQSSGTGYQTVMNVSAAGGGSGYYRTMLLYGFFDVGYPPQFALSIQDSGTGAGIYFPASFQGWHHVCGVLISSTSRKLYVDGRLVASSSASITHSTYTVAAVRAGLLRISSGNGYALVQSWASCPSLDHRFYNRALSDGEVAWIYNDTKAALLRPPTLYGSAWWTGPVPWNVTPPAELNVVTRTVF